MIVGQSNKARRKAAFALIGFSGIVSVENER